MLLDVANLADQDERFEGVIFLLRTVCSLPAETSWDLTHAQTLLSLDGRDLQSFRTFVMSPK